MKSFESLAHEAYDQFQQALDKSTTETPAWEALSQRTREAWIAATRKVAEQIQHVH